MTRKRLLEKAWLAKHINYQRDWRREWVKSEEGKRHSKVAHRTHWLMIKNFVRQEKDKPCMDCGRKYGYWCMDFDHRDASKKLTTVALASRSRSLDTLRQEIAKCDLVCSNCHRTRTFRRLCRG
jgi:hypothetical protein